MTTQGQGVHRISMGRRDAGKKGGKQGRRVRGRIPVRGGRWKTIHQTEKEANYRKKPEGSRRNVQIQRERRRLLIRRRRWDAMYQVEKTTNNESYRKRKGND